MITSRDLGGQVYEWDPVTSRCVELAIRGFRAFQHWETDDRRLVVHGAALAPIELERLPDPVRHSRLREMDQLVAVWSAGPIGERKGQVVLRLKLREWVSIGRGG